MKKFCLLLAILASVQIAGAQQVKSVEAARSSVEKAEKASQDAKKSVNPTTWIKLGQAYMEAYYAAQGDGWLGATDQELSLVMSGVKTIAEEQVVVAGTPMLKRVYDTKNYYFNSAGQLAIIETTTPVIENALGKAIEAYKKASELDVKGKKSKDIVEGMKIVDQKCLDEAYMAYNFGDLKLASEYFEKAANAFVDGCPVDTNAVYNVGFTSYMSGDYDRAKEWFNKSIAIGFDGENGEAFAKLADIADRQGDQKARLGYLEAAFSKYPQSQSVLIGLINYYISTGENTSRLFELIDGAKRNEPGNASLYYVEGNVHEKLGNEEAALAAYEECSKVDPNHEYGYIAKGIHFYNKAVEIQTLANEELDDAKYNALVEEFEVTLKSALEPFETALSLTKNDEVKKQVAEYLKNICFRFRTESDVFSQKYEKYSKISAGE